MLVRAVDRDRPYRPPGGQFPGSVSVPGRQASVFIDPRRAPTMGGFDLDLESIERELDDPEDTRVVLGELDGSTPGEEWVAEIASGNVLVLDIAGELDELAGRFAAPVKENGGSLVHFRGFLIVTPAGIEVDTARLGE